MIVTTSPSQPVPVQMWRVWFKIGKKWALKHTEGQHHKYVVTREIIERETKQPGYARVQVFVNPVKTEQSEDPRAVALSVWVLPCGVISSWWESSFIKRSNPILTTLQSKMIAGEEIKQTTHTRGSVCVCLSHPCREQLQLHFVQCWTFSSVLTLKRILCGRFSGPNQFSYWCSTHPHLFLTHSRLTRERRLLSLSCVDE